MPRKPDERIAKAKELFLSGMKIVEIAGKLGVPEGTIRSWKNRYRWDCNVANNERNVANNIRNVAKESRRKKKAVADEVKDVMQNSDLTDRQRLFCIKYIRCFNATKAYQEAYGVDHATAASIGYRLLANDGVKKEIMRLKQNRLNRELLSEEDIVQRYIDIAYADINDYMEIKDGAVKLKDSDTFDGMLIKKVSSGNTSYVELHDSMKALQWLSEHMDLATQEQKIRIAQLKSNAGVSLDENENSVQIYLPEKEETEDG